MSTSSPTVFGEGMSSTSASLQEPHERTSLLESAAVNPAVAHRQGIQHPRPVNEEAADVAESIRGKADSEPAAGIVGIVSVLILGTYASLVSSPIRAILQREGFLFTLLGGYRCLHRERRRFDHSCNVQHDLFRI